MERVRRSNFARSAGRGSTTAIGPAGGFVIGEVEVEIDEVWDGDEGLGEGGVVVEMVGKAGESLCEIGGTGEISRSGLEPPSMIYGL